VDGAYYHRWAQDILAGGEMSRQVFFMHPAYPHLIAAVYALVGPVPVAVAVVQAFLGAAGVVLFFHLCRLWFAPATAALSALVLALYRPLIINDALLETVELGLFFLLLSLLLTATAPQGRPGLRRAAAGVAFFLAVLNRGNLMLCAPVLLLAPILQTSGPRLHRLRAALPMAAGMFAVLLAVGVRNRVQAGEWVMTMSSSGANFYLSNHRGAEADARNPPPFLRNDPRFLEADFRAEAERLTGRKLDASQTSRFWRDKALEEIAAAPLPAAVRFLRRLGLAWSGYEIANNYELAYLRGLTPLDLLPLPGFVWLVGLGAVGAGLCWRRRRELFLLYAMGGVYLLSLGLFFQTSRMRIYLVPFLIPLAVEAALWLVSTLRARRFLPAAAAAGAAVVLTAASATQATEITRAVDRAQALSSHAVALMAADRIREARALQEQALALTPNNPFLLVNAGDAALRAGDLERAVQLCSGALALRPELATAHTCRGIALARRGALAAAEKALRRAVELDRQAPEPGFNLAVLFAQTGRRVEAQQLLAEIAARHPDFQKARQALELLRRAP
jgi:tetratricopeptide (TPR) repeat protein